MQDGIGGGRMNDEDLIRILLKEEVEEYERASRLSLKDWVGVAVGTAVFVGWCTAMGWALSHIV